MSTEMTWHELFVPRGLTIGSVTNVARQLASRPRTGWRSVTPQVVIEQWGTPQGIRYLVGIELPLGDAFVRRLAASVPGLLARRLDPATSPRVPLRVGRDVRLTSVAATLRTDVAVEVSRAIGHALATASTESVVMQWVFGPAQGRRQEPETFSVSERLGFTTPRSPSAVDQSAWRQKALEPLYAVRGRIGTTGKASGLAGLAAAIQLADSSRGVVTVQRPSPGVARAITHAASKRWSLIVSALEAAVLLGWPIDGVDGRALPIGDVPPQSPAIGRRLGVSLHPAALGQPVTWPAASLSRHCHVIGVTGTGKSNLLASQALDDIHAGRSVAVIEPKGDLCEVIMARLSPDEVTRVIAIDAGATVHPVGSNPLRGAPETVERRADDIVSLFRDLHGTAIGPRSADVLLHALLIAGRIPGGTLIDVVAILTNPTFRARCARQINDPLVLSPWLAWFENVSDGERAQIVAPILNKLRGFTARASIRRMLGQSDPAWDWDTALQDGSIVLISVNRGVVGGDAARLVGSLLMSQLWSAIQRRTRIPEQQRKLATVIVDEFQLFVGSLDFDDVLATARGMGVSVSAAHQLLPQVSPTLQKSLAANARNKLVLRPSVDDASSLAKLLGSQNVTADDLVALRPFEAVVTTYGQPGAIHVLTPELPPASTNPVAVRRASQQRFGHDGDEVDRRLLERWNTSGTSSESIGRQKRRTS